MSNTKSNAMCFPAPDITQQMLHMVQSTYVPKKIAEFTRTLSTSNGNTFHGVLPLHLQRFCERLFEIRNEISDRLANEKVNYQNIGITTRTKHWFMRMVFDGMTLTYTLESAILQLYPKSMERNTVLYITHDWEVVSFTNGWSHPNLNPLRDTALTISALLTEVLNFDYSGIEHELKTSSV